MASPPAMETPPSIQSLNPSNHPITPPLIPNSDHLDHSRTPPMPNLDPQDFQGNFDRQVRPKTPPMPDLNHQDLPRTPPVPNLDPQDFLITPSKTNYDSVDHLRRVPMLSLGHPRTQPRPILNPAYSPRTTINSDDVSVNETYGFPYVSGYSMAGIFFLDSNGNPSFNYIRPLPFLNLPEPKFFSIPAPFTIFSSSKGLLLCRDFVSYSYHIFNPFKHSNYSYRRIPDAPRSHEDCSSPVLALDLKIETDPVFYIICPVHVGFGNYSFDVFSSKTCAWTMHTAFINLGRPIVANSGISNGLKMAFWLLEVPHVIVKYTVEEEEGTGFAEVFGLPPNYPPYIHMKLGRINDVAIGLVTATEHIMTTSLIFYGQSSTDSWCLHSARPLEVLCHDQGIMPELLRFETDVVVWIDGQMIVWEIFPDESGNVFSRNSWLHGMPTWVKVPVSIGDTVPYVCTSLVAADFKSNAATDVQMDQGEESDHQDVVENS